MDDARPVGLAHRRDLREAGEQPAHERAPAVPRARVDDQTGRLVDDHDVVVGVHDVDDDGVVRLRRCVAGGRGCVQLDDAALVEAGRALGDHLAVDPHPTGIDEVPGDRAARAEEHGGHPVEPLARKCGRDHLPARPCVGHLSPAERAGCTARG
jgi:hypothetical protein